MAELKTAVVVIDQVGYQNDPKLPPTYAVHGEEIEVTECEYKRLRGLGAIGELQDAARFAALSKVTPPDNYVELAAAHRKSMAKGVGQDFKTVDEAIGAGAHPDVISGLRDKEAMRGGVATTVEPEQPPAEAKSQRPPRNQTKAEKKAAAKAAKEAKTKADADAAGQQTEPGFGSTTAGSTSSSGTQAG